MMKQVTLRLPEDLYRVIKHKSLITGITVAEEIRYQLIHDYLRNAEE